MMLLPELDYKKTKDNVRQLLKECRSMQRRGGIQIYLESPVISDMPRHQSNRNNVEHKMIKRVENISKETIEANRYYWSKIRSISVTLKLLSDVSREILYYSYCVTNPYSMVKLSQTIKVYRENEQGQVETIQYSVKNIEKLKDNALIEFAEAYYFENLLVYKN